ncbi:MAG: hypothetical protein MUF58_06075 [Arcicella sp.]|jgi:hypothetical protein|nr:hypothetical protein [Arcicella sp.]
MEIYAIYNGRQASFNSELNALQPPSPPKNFITLQVVFDASVDTFKSNDYKKFVLFNIDLSNIQAMFPYKNIVVTDTFEGGDITCTMFKIILNDSARGYFVKTKEDNTVPIKKAFDLAVDESVNTLDATSYEKFLKDTDNTYETFACSVSKTGGPCK